MCAQIVQEEQAEPEEEEVDVGQGRTMCQASGDTTKAAEIRVHVTWAAWLQGEKRLDEIGPVKLVAFDAREQKWGAVRDTWGREACEDKLDSANMARVLNETKVKFNFRVKVHQTLGGKLRTSAARDWHFALLTCGDVEQAPLLVTLEATKGALNMFAANSNFDSTSCPVPQLPWFAVARDDAGFWVLLVLALFTGCSSVLAVVLCRHFRAKGRKGEASSLHDLTTLHDLPPPALSGAQAVIGRPPLPAPEVQIVDPNNEEVRLGVFFTGGPDMVSMAIARGLYAALLVASASAQTSFTKAQLEANITLTPDSAWHLGGFCFGQASGDTTKAAEIRVHVTWAAWLDEIGPVKLVAFDAREQKWGAVRDTWGREACEDKLDSANMARVLNETKVKFNFRVKVHQTLGGPKTSAARDWHFALLTCGDVEQAPLLVTLEATKGALNMFAANSNFDSTSCPVPQLPWFAVARDDAGFWVLLVLALFTGCSSVLAVVLCRHFRAKGRKGEASSLHDLTTLHDLPPPALSGAQAVIGRPCAPTTEEKIVAGQVSANPQQDSSETAPERSSTETPESCV
ncbi:Ca-P60A [Symbiodinium natans]|uniref:Ca-P60A protein n=1 Tax=Symbiodinium natans TaxID=878477 RepID=A0A812JTA4_9DINO|nr:Ca-P60A [Symbiodinium natans]